MLTCLQERTFNCKLMGRILVLAISPSLKVQVVSAGIILVLMLGIWNLVGEGVNSAIAETPIVTTIASDQKQGESGATNISKTPDAPDCDPNWTLVGSPNVGTNSNFLLGVADAGPGGV